MGCMQSDLDWDEAEFSFSTTSGEYAEKQPHKQETILRRARQSMSSRFNLGRTTRKSLEIFEKRASLNLGNLGCRESFVPDQSKKRISLSEVGAWSDPNCGFQNLLNSCTGRRFFIEFLEKEYSHENLLFWLACDQVKEEKDDTKFKELVEQIFEDFLTCHSSHEVSLDSKVKENLTNMRDNPTRDMFVEAQGKIFNLMHRDSYPRFLSSPIYRDIASLDDT